jgi:signal transduction histidine kinase
VNGNEETIQYEKIDFEKFLHDVKESFDFINPNNQITITITEESRESSLLITGNKNLLRTSIINLFDNACKFSSNNVVDIRLTNNDKWLFLTIKDAGIGVLDNDMEKILSPFYRGENAMPVKGAGIGLSLSFRIINLHQGKLEMQSTLGKGTQVLLKLPITIS